MDKQEVIEKIKSAIPDPALDDFEEGEESGLTYALNLVEEMGTVVVPQFVADWIEWCKRNSVTLLGGFSAIDELGLAICNDKKVKSLDASGWATKNQETFTKAWFYGYEVEKEKLYTVEIPNPNAGGHVVLCKTSDGIVSIAFTGMARWQGCKNFQLTEAEIKKDFDWAWKFRKEVEE